MNCSYTAQGFLICQKPKNSTPISEGFTVRKDPNDKAETDWCAPINSAFLDIAKKNMCNVTANLNKCTFQFACQKPE